MVKNLSKPVLFTKPANMSLSTALHGLKYRLFVEGDTFKVDEYLFEMLAGERFRVTYPGGKTEVYKLKPVTGGKTA